MLLKAFKLDSHARERHWNNAINVKFAGAGIQAASGKANLVAVMIQGNDSVSRWISLERAENEATELK